MTNQRRILGNVIILLCCIAVSQALFDFVKNPGKTIAHGVTGIADQTLKAKGKFGRALHDVSPHVLGPLSDALDPAWLTGMNYTRWVLDMQVALKDGNTTEWVKAVSTTFNLDRVIDDVKSSTATKSTCLACKFVVNLARHMMKAGKTDHEIANTAIDLCIELKIQHPDVCKGVIHLIGDDAVFVIRTSDMRPAQICSFFLGEGCLGGHDARHQWRVSLPPKRKPANHTTQPPMANKPVLKVLQITDTHYDPYYQEGSNAACDLPMCCRASVGQPKSNATTAGKWGDYRSCDSPMRLMRNAFQHIVDTHKDIDYIMWTGDLPPHDVWNQTKQGNIENVIVSNALMAEYFKGIPIFPSVGNHESCPVDHFVPPAAPADKNMSYLYDHLDKEWSRWLPQDTSETIRRGGFYSTLVRPGFRIISVNGNYCSRNNFWLILNSTDPVGQLAWLVGELDAAEAKGEKVHIIGHVPPGQPDCLKVWSRNYYDIVNRYESTIVAQFFGHTHFDEYEVFYDTKQFKRPVSVGYIAPSITPWIDVNPAYRIYYVDGDHHQTTRAIVDMDTWKMNLDEANMNDNPVWYKSYSAKEAYGMPSLLPKDWDELINRMSKDKDLFEIYHRNYYRDSPVRPRCDEDCRRRLLCDLRMARSHDKQNLCHTLKV